MTEDITSFGHKRVVKFEALAEPFIANIEISHDGPETDPKKRRWYSYDLGENYTLLLELERC